MVTVLQVEQLCVLRGINSLSGDALEDSKILIINCVSIRFLKK